MKKINWKKFLWPVLFTASNLLCLLQLFDDSDTLQPFTRQYTHMTLLVTAVYAGVFVRKVDVAALCLLCFFFSVQWHSGKKQWRLPDGWLSRVAILYMGGRVVVDPALACLVVTSSMAAITWISPELEYLVFVLLGLIGLLLIYQHEKMYWWDILATAIFSCSGYLCYTTGDLGLHGLWHTCMATAMAFAVTVPKDSKWHLMVPVDAVDAVVGIPLLKREPIRHLRPLRFL